MSCTISQVADCSGTADLSWQAVVTPIVHRGHLSHLPVWGKGGKSRKLLKCCLLSFSDLQFCVCFSQPEDGRQTVKLGQMLEPLWTWPATGAWHPDRMTSGWKNSDLTTGENALLEFQFLCTKTDQWPVEWFPKWWQTLLFLPLLYPKELNLKTLKLQQLVKVVSLLAPLGRNFFFLILTLNCDISNFRNSSGLKPELSQ